MKNNKKSILITGASSGIGRHMSEAFASRGWIVWAGYRDEKAKEELLQINSNNIRPLRIDVTDMKLINKARKVVESSENRLDVLFNNAGVALGGPIEMLDIEDIKKVYDVNFFGYIRMIQTFLPLLRKSAGRIINMSSIGGLMGSPFLIPYSSSKFAVEGMSDSLRRELSNQNIHVSIIEPGPMQTKIWEKSLQNSESIFNKKGEILSLYQPAVNNLKNLTQKSNKFTVPLEELEKHIVLAAESPKPRSRYLVYRNNILLKILISFSPSKLIDFFFRKSLHY